MRLLRSAAALGDGAGALRRRGGRAVGHPGAPTRAAPCLGEDTFTVLTELIGMDPDEAQLLADGVVEITG
ncbi:MAG: hypothetical protein R2749_04450 [Acidimicrobiales bacterium]